MRLAPLAIILLLATSLHARDLIIHGATVIDGTGAPPRPSVDVVIRGETIVALKSSRNCRHPKSATVIDGTGKFVIPGLVDMHAHVLLHPWDEKGEITPRHDREATLQMLQTFLHFGVTSVRDTGASTAEAILLRQRLRDGTVVGPTLYTAGRILNSSNFQPEPFVKVTEEAAVRREIRWQAAAGVDLIKVYSSMPPDLVRVAIDEAHKQKLPIVGHLQRTTWTDAARMGIDGVEHAAPWSIEYVAEDKRESVPGSLFGRAAWLEHADSGRIDEMITALREQKVVVDSTLMAMHTKFWGDDPRYLQSDDLKYVPDAYRRGWPKGSFTASWTTTEYEEAKKRWPLLLALTRRMHEGGVRMVVGTDTPTPWTVPGASVHDEMQLLADAGIAPLDIIRMATSNAAAALRREREFGVVAPGLRADLVILERDPLAAIANTRSIVSVVQKGKVIPRLP